MNYAKYIGFELNYRNDRLKNMGRELGGPVTTQEE